MTKNITLIAILVFSLFISILNTSAQSVPANARAKSLSDNSIRISWSGSAEAFNIQRSMDGKVFTDLATVNGGSYNFTDTGLSASTPYLYKICAVAGTEKSAYTAAFGAATKALDTIPDITDDISAVLTVQTENTNANEGSKKLIDNDVYSKYLFYATTGWMKLNYPKAAVVTQYALTSANDAPERDPQNWKLEGSNDNSAWTLLDVRENQKFAGRYSKLHYSVNNATAYTYYRLSVTKNNGSTSITQIAEWQLFAETEVVRNTVAPPTPAAFNYLTQKSANGMVDIMPASHMIILNWTDNASNEDYFLLERSTNQTDWDWSTRIPKNNTRYRSVELNPSTKYYFRLKAVNDAGESAYTNIISATTKTDTPPDSIVEDWDVHRATLYLQYYDDEVAIYYDKDVDPTITWPRTVFGGIWKYLKGLYGNYSDPRLYIYFHAGKYSGGHPSTWSRADHHYLNVLDLGTNATTATAWQSFGGNNLDLPVHEIGHIMEGASLYVHGSPERVIWGDSKYAEIFNYDVYVNNNLPDQAKRWYEDMMRNSDSTTPRTGIFWFRDFYYPIYSQYGGNKLLANFFVQMAKYLPQKNGDYIGNMNWGEFIHFYSIAAGANLKEQATVAFGWSDEWEMQFVKAQADYPAEYPTPPFNLMDGGESEVNFENSNAAENSAKLFDKNYATNYVADRTASPTTAFNIIVKGAVPTLLREYSLVSADNSLQTSQYDPAVWNLYGSDNLTDWQLIDEKTAQVFSTRKEKKTISLNQEKSFRNYKLEILKLKNTSAKKLYLAELEFRGSAVDPETSVYSPASPKFSMEELWKMADENPGNNLKIRSVDGRLLFDEQTNAAAWKNMLYGNILTKGIYIYTFKPTAESMPISAKMIVQ